jgi:uncharacterized protein YjiS (DUF1127 family)
MSIQAFHPHAAGSRSGLGIRLSSVLAAIADAYANWHERSTQRRILARLDDRMLRDVGLSRADVEREVAKPFWQA